jgi:MFS family permease
MLQALRVRDFRLLWVSRFVGLAGRWLLVVAIPAHVLALTGSPLATGLTLAAEQLPAVLLGPIAGVVVDRWDRRRVMIVADVLRAAAVVLVLLANSPDMVWFVYVGLTAQSIGTMVFRPAAQAHTPSVLADPRLLSSANSLNATTDGIVRLFGPPLGAILLVAGGIHAVIYIDIACCLVSALIVAMTKRRQDHRLARDGNARQALRDLANGLAFISGERMIGRLLLTNAVFLAANAALTALLVPFGVASLGGSEQTGYLLSALGIGYLAGAPISKWAADRFTIRRIVAIGQAAAALAFFLLFNAPSLPIALLAGVLIGMPGVVVIVSVQTALQHGVPDRFLGRVSAAFFTAEAAATLLGSIAGPALVATAGSLTFALNTGSALALAAALLTYLLVPKRPAVDTRSAPAAY